MVIFALITSISPGPVNIIATATGANWGYLRTVPHIIGATFGFVFILFFLGLGLAEFINGTPYLTAILTYAGGGFLLYLAYKIAMQNTESDNENAPEIKAPSFLQGILCQWLNPKAWVVSLAGISVFLGNHGMQINILLIFCGVFFVVCYASISVWAILGVAIKAILDIPRHYKLFNISMGLLLTVTVVYTFFISR